MNNDYLNSNFTPSIISNNYDKIEKEKNILIIMNNDKNKLLISNGLLNIGNKKRKY